MFLETGNVLIKIKEALNGDFNLVIWEMWERRLKKIRHVILDVPDIVIGRTQRHFDPSRLHQREHVC